MVFRFRDSKVICGQHQELLRALELRDPEEAESVLREQTRYLIGAVSRAKDWRERRDNAKTDKESKAKAGKATKSKAAKMKSPKKARTLGRQPRSAVRRNFTRRSGEMEELIIAICKYKRANNSTRRPVTGRTRRWINLCETMSAS